MQLRKSGFSRAAEASIEDFHRLKSLVDELLAESLAKESFTLEPKEPAPSLERTRWEEKGRQGIVSGEQRARLTG